MNIKTKRYDTKVIKWSMPCFILLIVTAYVLFLFCTNSFSQEHSAEQQIKINGTIKNASPESKSTWPLGFPTANMNISNAVSMEDIERIAVFQAKRTWGSVYLISEIPCCDQNGDLVAFFFVFQINSKLKPANGVEDVSFSEIQHEIAEARELYPDSLNAYNQAKQDMDIRFQEAEKDKSGSPVIDTDKDHSGTHHPQVMSIPVTDAFKEAYEAKEKLRKKMTGADRFGTVMVSARYDLIPVPMVIHGLPHFYTTGDLMQKKAGEAIGGYPTIKRIYLGGPLDQWYEFTNLEDKTILVEPRMGKTYPQNDIYELMKHGVRMKGNPDNIDQRWSAIKKAAREDQK